MLVDIELLSMIECTEPNRWILEEYYFNGAVTKLYMKFFKINLTYFYVSMCAAYIHFYVYFCIST